MKKNKTLAEQYREVCNAYRDALNEMWETDGQWLSEDYDLFNFAGCLIRINEVRKCVDLKVDFKTVLAWHDYNVVMSHGQELGYKEARLINLLSWINGYPEDKKVPKETRDAWEKEYWEDV